MDDDITSLRNTVWIITEVLGSCVLLLLILTLILLYHVRQLYTRSSDQTAPETHAFRVPVIQPDEELARRGYAQYAGSTDSSLFCDQDYSSIGRSQDSLYPTKKY